MTTTVTLDYGRPQSRITRRQAEVLAALATYQREHGYAPTVRELGRLTGIRSISGVAQHLATLERAGYIRRTPRLPRALTILALPKMADPDAPATRAERGSANTLPRGHR